MKCALVFLLLACTALAAPTDEEDVGDELALGSRRFTANVYKEIVKKNNGNLIFSPFSAVTVLALLSAGANGPTHDELIDGLALPPSQSYIQKSFKQFLPKVKSDNEYLKLSSANKVYAGKDVKLESAFEKVAVDIYESGVENVDFSKATEAASNINSWVESKTNHKIKNLISPDDLGESTALVLVNALYLSAQWSKQFEKYNTRPAKFYKTASDSVEVPTMSMVDHFNYYENTEMGVKFLELPYMGEGLSMVIALPNEKEGLTALEKNVEKLFDHQPMKWERVSVKMPKFTIESEIKFVDILKSLGIKKIFGAGADLSGLSSTNKDLFVSNVIQKAFINVTETGTEAAAATAVHVALMSAPFRPVNPPKYFHVEHPFTYFIKLHNVIIFAGRVNFNN